MQFEFELNSKLEGMKQDTSMRMELSREDRRDQRVNMQADRQKEMIEQRKADKPPKNFESAGNDILGGGFDLGSFDPS